MRKLIIGGAALALAATLAGGCSAASGASGGTGGSHGSGNSDPGCIPGLPDTCKTTPPQAGGGQPIASADAAPLTEPAEEPHMRFGDCSIDIFPPHVGLTPGAHLVLATAHSYCRIQPWSTKIIMSIQYCMQAVCSDNDWVDEPHPEIRDNVPPIRPLYDLLYADADCLTDRYYRVAFKVSGESAVYENGKRVGSAGPFATPDHPITAYGPSERFSKSECSGK